MFSCSRRVVNGVGARGRKAVPGEGWVGASDEAVDAEAGGQSRSLSWASRLASTTAVAALALIRGPGRESGRRRDVQSVRQFRQLLRLSGRVHRDDQFGLQQRLQQLHGDVHRDHCPGALRLQPKRIPDPSAHRSGLSARPTALAIRSRCGLRHPSRARGLASTQATFLLATWSFGGVTGVPPRRTGEVTRDLSDPAILDPPPPSTRRP